MERPKREKKPSARAAESKEYEEEWEKNKKRKVPDSVVKKESSARGTKTAKKGAKNIKQDPDIVIIESTPTITAPLTGRTGVLVERNLNNNNSNHNHNSNSSNNYNAPIVLDGVGSTGNPVVIKGERKKAQQPTSNGKHTTLPTTPIPTHNTPSVFPLQAPPRSTGAPTPAHIPTAPLAKHTPIAPVPIRTPTAPIPTNTTTTTTTTTSTSATAPTPAQIKAEAIKQEQNRQTNVKQELQKEISMLKSLLPSVGLPNLGTNFNSIIGTIGNMINGRGNTNNIATSNQNNNSNINTAVSNSNSSFTTTTTTSTTPLTSTTSTTPTTPVKRENSLRSNIKAESSLRKSTADEDEEPEDNFDDVLIIDDDNEIAPRRPNNNTNNNNNNTDEPDVIYDLTGDEIRIEVNTEAIIKKRANVWTSDVPTAPASNNNNTNRALDPDADKQDVELGENLLGDDGGLLRHDEIPEEGREPHECVITPLQPHQKQALYWMMEREKQSYRGCRGGMLLDDPGLGKTLSMISLIVTHSLNKENRKTGELTPAPTLVVAPSHLINVWKSEIEKHTVEGYLNVGIYHGSNRRRRITLDSLMRGNSGYHVIITSYGVVNAEFVKKPVIRNGVKHYSYDWKDDSIFNRIWARIILDEAHGIRNHQAATSRAVMNLSADLTWVVTATPVHNRLNDLYPLFRFMNMFTDFPEWKNTILIDIKSKPVTAFARLQSIIQKIGIRRPKTIMHLPARDEKRVSVTLSENENEFYEALFAYSQERVQQFLRRIANLQNHIRQLEGTGLGAILQARIQRARLCILVLLLRLRQACCHPQLVILKMRRLKHIPTELGYQLEDDDEDDNYARQVREAIRILAAVTQQSQAGGIMDDECSACFDDTAEYIAKPCGHKYCGLCRHQMAQDKGRGYSACVAHACRKEIRGYDRILIHANNDAFNNTCKTNNNCNTTTANPTSCPPNTTTSTSTNTTSNTSTNNNSSPNSSQKGKQRFMDGLDSDDEGDCVAPQAPPAPVVTTVPVKDEDLEDVLDEDPLDIQLPSHLSYGASSKLQVLLKMIKEDIARGDKAIIVSQWTGLLDIIAMYLAEQRPIINVNRIDGRTPPLKRHALVEGFQTDPTINVCLLSLLAGAEGITLTVSRKLYHIDPWWNPAKTTQASDRVHRIGQERDVEIVHLHTANSIEDSIVELQDKKKKVAGAVMGEFKVTEDMTWANEIKLLFKLTTPNGTGETVEINMDDFGPLPTYRRNNSNSNSTSSSSHNHTSTSPPCPPPQSSQCPQPQSQPPHPCPPTAKSPPKSL